MKVLSILTICLIISQSSASILEAQDYFSQQNYKESFKEYKKLAQLGNVRGQYNIAIMTFRGLGTEKNNIEAYAWASIAHDLDPEINKLLSLIKNNLTESDLLRATQRASTLKAKYGYNESKILLGAITLNKTNENSLPFEMYNHHDGYYIKRNKVSKKKVDYPQKALRKTGRGWVELSYSIYPDGTVQDINILNQYPHKLFAPAAIDFISKQKFDFYKGNEIGRPDTEYYTTFRVKFGISGTSLLGPKSKTQINKVLKSALAGSLEAQYNYINLFFSILNGGGGINGNVINKWLLRASQFGISKAQFRLGKNIYNGYYCRAEKQKGFDWILRAAENGIADAQYLAYFILKTENLNNFTNIPSNHWLLQAAKNNSNIARLKYAKLIASKDDYSPEEMDRAFEFLEKYANEIANTADWYQTHALLLARINNYKAAENSIKKAIKVAKKSHWDLTKLKIQQQNIKAKKSPNY